MDRRINDRSRALVQKLWNYCNLLRDDGLSYGDYVEQLTYLLFLKMAHERTQPPLDEPSRLPDGFDWPSLLSRSGPELERHYIDLLDELGKEADLLGLIFRKAQNRIQDPQKLRRLIVDLIDQETWLGVDADIKGDAYEGLLEKNAADRKSGAGQYFTPRALIRAMVDVMRPLPGQKIADPAAGTGGFMLVAHEYISTHYELDRDQKIFLRDETFSGTEIVDNTARLCAMNLFLHGVDGTDIDGKSAVEVRDALLTPPTDKVDIVLANPPFGKKSSMTFVADDGTRNTEEEVVARSDFWASTANKQLNFLQHIVSMLKIGGSAAVVLPDNVLTDAGAGETIRRRLLAECELHTLLRLPTGIFYAQNVKANVLFFNRRAPSSEPATKEVWVYDFRTNQHFTLKERPMKRSHLDDFAAAYRPGRPLSERVETEKLKRWPYAEIVSRNDFSLDLWADVRDESVGDPSQLPAPEVIARQIVENATAGIEAFAAVATGLAGLTGATAIDSDREEDPVEALLEHE